jgi:hypothetical protein
MLSRWRIGWSFMVEVQVTEDLTHCLQVLGRPLWGDPALVAFIVERFVEVTGNILLGAMLSGQHKPEEIVVDMVR